MMSSDFCNRLVSKSTGSSQNRRRPRKYDASKSLQRAIVFQNWMLQEVNAQIWAHNLCDRYHEFFINREKDLTLFSERKLLGSRRNIFFLETFCFGEGDGQAKLNYRQACSIEAAARTNPNMAVNLFYLSPAPPSNLTRQLTQLLLKYDNVQVSRIKLPEYIRNTPIEHWYSSGILAKSGWPNIHMSDFLRLLTLWKYGGIYLDLDVVVIT